MEAVLRLYTFKDGLLSKLAHDLLLEATRFEVELAGELLRAHADTRYFQVLGSMRNGELEAPGLSSSDKARILENLRSDVLRSEQFPEATLEARVEAEAGGVNVTGSLCLCGTSRPFAMRLAHQAGRMRGAVDIVPSRFGIAPFRAFAGALKVQDRVRLTVDAETPAAWSMEAPTGSMVRVMRWQPATSDSSGPRA
jgi:hypothetical protein